jgi:hypothetical protein
MGRGRFRVDGEKEGHGVYAAGSTQHSNYFAEKPTKRR